MTGWKIFEENGKADPMLHALEQVQVEGSKPSKA